MTYGADMRHFVITGGVPCVMFGAGDVRLAHAPDESIPIEDLLTAITTTAVFIADWCGVDLIDPTRDTRSANRNLAWSILEPRWS